MALGYFEGYDNTIYQLDRKEHGIFIDDRCASEYKLINPDGVSHDSDKLWKVFDFLYNPTEMNTPFSKEFAINKISDSIKYLKRKSLDTTNYMLLKLYYYFLTAYSSKYSKKDIIGIIDISETTGYNISGVYVYNEYERTTERQILLNDEIDVLKSILVQSCDVDSIESQLPKTILTSKFNIYEYFYNYLLMDFDVQVVPKRIMDKETQKFVDYKLNEFLIPDKELRLKDEILSIKAKYNIKDREQFFR